MMSRAWTSVWALGDEGGTAKLQSTKLKGS